MVVIVCLAVVIGTMANIGLILLVDKIKYGLIFRREKDLDKIYNKR